MPQPIFQIKNLNLQLGKKPVLSITNFEIHRGITYAVIGQAGAGKTSLLELLAGVRHPSGGTIIYEGEVIPRSGLDSKSQMEIYYLPQLPSRDRKAQGTMKQYLLKHIQTASWTTDSAADRLKDVARRMNLGDRLERKMKTLSPGEKRWVDLAACLASDAKVIIIDELEQHLSYDDLEQVKRQLNRKCGHEGTTLLVSILNPTTMRRMTGVSVTLDHGRIAMIRSVRDGSRIRRSPGGGGSSNRTGSARSEKSSRSRHPRK